MYCEMSVLSITIHSRIFGPQTDHDGLGLWCITPPSINISVISGGGGKRVGKRDRSVSALVTFSTTIVNLINVTFSDYH